MSDDLFMRLPRKRRSFGDQLVEGLLTGLLACALALVTVAVLASANHVFDLHTPGWAYAVVWAISADSNYNWLEGKL